MVVVEAKVFVRDFQVNIPQWLGEAFLLVDSETNELMRMEGVLYNQWNPSFVDKRLGAYNEIGYGTELPQDTGVAGEWREVPIMRLTVFPDDPEKDVILLLGRPPQWS